MKRRHLNLRKLKSQHAFKGLAKVFWNPVGKALFNAHVAAPHNLQFCWQPWSHTATRKPAAERFA
jgi:hypothetical protein